MLHRRGLVSLVALAAGGSRTASGQGVEGPTTIVVPFTPGTCVDILARLIGPFLQSRFNQPLSGMLASAPTMSRRSRVERLW
jgi:tripartite-type tricarboxylate transporter receptor subunit TctC